MPFNRQTRPSSRSLIQLFVSFSLYDRSLLAEGRIRRLPYDPSGAMPHVQRQALSNMPTTQLSRTGHALNLNPYEGDCRKPMTPEEAAAAAAAAAAAKGSNPGGWGTTVALRAQFCAREGCRNFQIPSSCKVWDEKEGEFTIKHQERNVKLRGCGRCKVVKYCSNDCTYSLHLTPRHCLLLTYDTRSSFALAQLMHRPKSGLEKAQAALRERAAPTDESCAGARLTN